MKEEKKKLVFEFKHKKQPGKKNLEDMKNEKRKMLNENLKKNVFLKKKFKK